MYLQRWHCWCHVKLLPSRRVLCTPYNHTPCHFMQSHLRKVRAYLAVTCRLHFWRNDRDLLRATAVIIIIIIIIIIKVFLKRKILSLETILSAYTHRHTVTRGWSGYRNKSQHRKLTPEKKIRLPLPQGFEPATFQLRVRRSNH